MPRRKSRILTDLELAIMQIVWDRGQASVEEIRDDLAATGHTLALPSIRTMLSILQKKKYLTRKAEGRRHIYSPRVPREKAQQSILRDVIDRAFQGSATDMVAALIDARLVDPHDIDKATDLIRKAEEEDER